MSKELEALENIKREADIPYFSSLYDIDMWREDFATIETALKVLEIIKKKRVDCLEISLCSKYETYMAFFNKWNWYGEYDEYVLTQEEFNLLKEVLKK